VTSLDRLKVKIFLDGAHLEDIRRAAKNKLIKGFTTNPTLMRQAGVTDYAAFAKEAIAAARGLPISFEVFSDDADGMEREARTIHGWGGNTYVKIPVTNTQGVSTAPLVRRLSADGISLNVTAILTLEQVREMVGAVAAGTPAIISVFAGRVADTGVDSLPLMRSAVDILNSKPMVELLWASPRELLNIFHADTVGCHIITVTQSVLAKASLVGKDLSAYSLETVKMFHDDARAAGYSIA
jgi:transaldolase